MIWEKPGEHLAVITTNSGFSKNYNYLIFVSYYIRGQELVIAENWLSQGLHTQLCSSDAMTKGGVGVHVSTNHKKARA